MFAGFYKFLFKNILIVCPSICLAWTGANTGWTVHRLWSILNVKLKWQLHGWANSVWNEKNVCQKAIPLTYVFFSNFFNTINGMTRYLWKRIGVEIKKQTWFVHAVTSIDRLIYWVLCMENKLIVLSNLEWSLQFGHKPFPSGQIDQMSC